MHFLEVTCVLMLCSAIVGLIGCDERLPTIIKVSKDKVVSRGERVVLECFVKHLGGNAVAWFHQAPGRSTPRLIATGRSRITEDPRFTVEAKEEQFNLEIREVFEDDAGSYQCQIAATEPITRTIVLNVKTPPVIGEDSSRDMTVMEGNPVTLRCNATGFPTPFIYWQRNDEGALPQGGTRHIGPVLEIPSISKEERGIYVCVADNRVGEGDRRSVALQVQFKPVIRTPKPRVAQAINYQLNAQLECEIEGYPPPYITWTKEGEDIVNDKDFRTTDYSAAHEVLISQLWVLGVHASDLGLYTCVATNEQGTSEGHVELVESPRPDYSFGGNYRRPLPSSSPTLHSPITALTALTLTSLLYYVYIYITTGYLACQLGTRLADWTLGLPTGHLA